MYNKVRFFCLLSIVLAGIHAKPIKLTKLYGITDKYFNKKDKLLDKIFNKQFHFHIHDHHLHYDHVQSGESHQTVHHHNHHYENEPHDQHDQQVVDHHQYHPHLVHNQNEQTEEQTTQRVNHEEHDGSGQHNTENPNQQLGTPQTTTTKEEFIINVQPNVGNPHDQVPRHPSYGYGYHHQLLPNVVTAVPFHVGPNQPLTLQQHQALGGKPAALQQVPPIYNNPVYLLPPEYTSPYDTHY